MAIERCAIRNMVNHKTYELFFDNLDVPVENLVGEEAKGFRYVLDGRNAERTLISAEFIGDGSSFIDKVSTYTRERIVFDRPIGQNQRVRFSIARLWPIHERNEKGRLIRQRPFQVTPRCGSAKKGPDDWRRAQENSANLEWLHADWHMLGRSGDSTRRRQFLPGRQSLVDCRERLTLDQFSATGLRLRVLSV